VTKKHHIYLIQYCLKKLFPNSMSLAFTNREETGHLHNKILNDTKTDRKLFFEDIP
jgi:hypothetical protein